MRHHKLVFFAFLYLLQTMWPYCLSQAGALVYSSNSSSSRSPVTHQFCPACLNNHRPSFSSLPVSLPFFPLYQRPLSLSHCCPGILNWKLLFVFLTACHSTGDRFVPLCQLTVKLFQQVAPIGSGEYLSLFWEQEIAIFQILVWQMVVKKLKMWRSPIHHCLPSPTLLFSSR